MSLGLLLFTLVHVAISLAAIGSGLVVVRGLLAAERRDGWTALFLATTLSTSVSGFGFPFERLLPSHIVGAISIVVLAVAIVARYKFRLEGIARPTYVISAVMAFYFNVFVLVVQTFLKVPALKQSAPTQTEPSFAAAQLVVLAVFVWLAIASLRKFRPTASGLSNGVPATTPAQAR